MGVGDIPDNGRAWVRRAAVLLRRERDLRWKIPLFLVAILTVTTVVNVADYGLRTAVVVDGLGWGFFAWALLTFVVVDDRMEAVFPDEGGDDLEADASDSLRARYVRGDITHEAFKRRLDELLGAPVDDAVGAPGTTEEAGATGGVAGGEHDGSGGESGSRPADPVAILQDRFARGEIDEAEYERRLRVIRETADDHTTTETESAIELE